jgi:single-strand DNA-binding protein
MAWNINRVILVGRLSNDVELKYIPSGKAVAKFGIAVGGRPRQDGAESVSFFNVVVWDKPAETCAKFLSKGKQVALDGHLEQRSWTAQDGTKRSTVEVIAERVEFLGSPTGGGNRAPQAEKSAGDDVPLEDNFYDNTGFNPSPVDPNEPGF